MIKSQTKKKSLIMLKTKRVSLALLILLIGTSLSTVLLADEVGSFVNSADTKKYALIIVGASADQEHAERFKEWALTLRTSLKDDYGYPVKQLTLLLGDEDKNSFSIDGSSRVESIKSVFSNLSEKIKANDQLLVVLIGHGTGSGDQAKFNIVGPDITGVDFAKMLEPIASKNIVVVNTASASHDFSQKVSLAGRIVVSATRSRAEKYDTIFPLYFVEGLQNQNADRDKNKRVSVLEAFDYASSQVNNFYRDNDALASEHAGLDDNGDGVFSIKPGVQGDGRLAEVAYLDSIGGEGQALSPEAAKLRVQMDNIERDIFILRAGKKALTEEEYWGRIEPLLIQLAKTTREFDALQAP
ncbi:hypothetical protein NBRC116493_03530 [Aurantivibrio infirmus]